MPQTYLGSAYKVNHYNRNREVLNPQVENVVSQQHMWKLQNTSKQITRYKGCIYPSTITCNYGMGLKGGHTHSLSDPKISCYLTG